MNQSFCPDTFWNQSVTWADVNPDFTECFKQTILIWVPCGFLFICSPFDLYFRYKSHNADVPWHFTNICKTVALSLLICLTFVDIVTMLYMIKNADIIHKSQLSSVSLKTATFILVALLQIIHKMKGQVTSGFLFIFWLMLVFFEIPQLRSVIRNYDSENPNKLTTFRVVIFILYFTLITIVLILNCFADKKRRNTADGTIESNKESPELTSSFLNQILFQWFTHITWIGYRRPLTEADIYDINPENRSRQVIPPFDKYFAETIEEQRKQLKKKRERDKSSVHDKTSLTRTNGSVIPAIIKAYGMSFLYAGFLHLIVLALHFAQPFLLDELISFTDESHTAPLWQGVVLTLTMFFVTFFSAIVKEQNSYLTARAGMRIQTALISAIYRKALRISIATKKDTTVGEIVNLMSVDAQRFNEMIDYFHELWCGPLIMGIAICLLYRILGVAVFAGLAIMILMIPVSGVIYSKMEVLQDDEMSLKDERVKYMNEILNGMKVLKLYAWEPSFEKLISNIRAKEMKILKKIAILNSESYFSWIFSACLVSVVSQITFVLLGGELTPNVAFVSITLFNILDFPMEVFPRVVSYVIQVWVSVKRINKFLNAEEINSNNVTNFPSENALSIEQGNFTWGGEQTLKNINIQVKKGKLTALVGSVGCGKSSLLSSLLGEMEKISGSANVDGRIAYVSQQAWIQNASLQDNILFGRPMNKKFYDTVVESCDLNADLAMLPGGDRTEIGEKGINLSGGQKQRVALARAVYNDADIYLLDDPLSAVDSHVGKHIFTNVFEENGGLLSGKTRLLVTHAVMYLPKVDDIYVMVDGEITEHGSYRELLSQRGTFAEFLTQHIRDIADDEDLLFVSQDIIDTRDLKFKLERSISRRSDTISEKSNVIEKSDSKIQNDLSKLIDEEEAASGSVGIAVYIRYFRSMGVLFCFAAVLSSFLKEAASIYSNIWLSQWATDSRAIDPNDFRWRNLYIGVYAGLGGAQGVTVLMTSIIFAIGCLRAARDTHKRLLHNVMRLPMSFFDTTPSGRILNRFSNDVATIDDVLPDNMQLCMMMLFNVLAILAVISFSTPWFLVVVVPIAIIYYFIQGFFVSTSRQLMRMESITLSPIYNHFSETITGQSLIRAFGDVNRFIREFERRVDHNQGITYISIIAARWLAVRLEIVGALIVLFACLFAVLARDTINPATVGLSISYALQISQALSALVSIAADIETNIVAIERVNEYTNRKQEAPWKTIDVDPTWPQKGEIKFQDLQTRYRDGLNLVLDGTDFVVYSQEKIGVVGRTGSGKSSLALALFRILEAIKGKIIIDDINIAEIGLHSLRSRLSIIPQDPILFSGSLRMNIDPFNSYSDEAIWIALEQSHLKAFVNGLSEGFYYKISEGGENLSMGQRQLVCLARALLRKTKILILDEATAAIDIETDELIQQTIRREFSDSTILTIAHRLNTIVDYDRIIVLDQGRIVEYDRPEALLENRDSIFYGMAKNAGILSTKNGVIYEEDEFNTRL